MISWIDIGSTMRRSPGMTTLSFVALLSLGAAVSCGFAGPQGTTEANDAAERITAEINAYRGEAEPVPDADLFAMVYHRVQEDYVRSVPSEELIRSASAGMAKAYPDPAEASDLELVEAAVQSMLHSLDDYSVYYDRDGFRKLNEEIRGAFGGLGIDIAAHDEGIEVVSPIEDTPAERAGIKPNDVITHADGESLKGWTLREIVERLRGEPGEPVSVTVRRAGVSEPFDVRIVREVIHIASVRSELKGDIGYIRITHFVSDTGSKLRAKLRELREESAGHLRGFVIDLRNNPGGLLGQSVDVAGAFLSGGPVVSTRGRRPGHTYTADHADPSGGLPVVVMINEGSASAAEIVAGAIRDRHRGTVIGMKSYGKGSVQSTLPLSKGRGLKLTTALYYTPSGKTVEGGIEPDLEATDDVETEDVDEALDIAIRTVSDLAAGRALAGAGDTSKN